MNNKKKRLQTIPNWNAFENSFKNTATTELKDILIISNLTNGTNELLNQLVIDDKQDYCIQLMSLPEYQLC